jgi:hypothetical protein
VTIVLFNSTNIGPLGARSPCPTTNEERCHENQRYRIPVVWAIAVVHRNHLPQVNKKGLPCKAALSVFSNLKSK